MTVYFMGTELEDFPDRAGAVFHSSNGVRSARQSIQVAGGSTEDSNYIETPTLAVTDFWTGYYQSNRNGFGGTNNVIKWYAGGVQKLAFHWANTGTGQLEIRKWNGSTWDSLATVTDPIYITSLNSVRRLDFYIKLGNPGTFGVYWNNLPAISINTLDLSGIGTIDKIRFCCPPTSTEYYVSEVVVADWNTIGSKIVVRPPTGNGSYQEWTNGGFAVVDDTDATGADLAVSGTVGQRTTYTHAAFTALAATEVVAGVKVAATVNRDAGGPQNINFMTRISTTDYNGADTALNVSQTRIGKMWETSPATAVAWTIAEINAAHMGVRSRT